jgi:hypothetical protein
MNIVNYIYFILEIREFIKNLIAIQISLPKLQVHF